MLPLDITHNTTTLQLPAAGGRLSYRADGRPSHQVPLEASRRVVTVASLQPGTSYTFSWQGDAGRKALRVDTRREWRGMGRGRGWRHDWRSLAVLIGNRNGWMLPITHYGKRYELFFLTRTSCFLQFHALNYNGVTYATFILAIRGVKMAPEAGTSVQPNIQTNISAQTLTSLFC